MRARIGYINRNIKRYDRELYCKLGSNGVMMIFRRNKRFVVTLKGHDFVLSNLIDSPELVFSLTDNWKANGKPIEWGYEKILERLKSIDIWDDPDFIEKMDRENEKIDEAKSRHFRNETEAALLDNKKAIQRGFSDVNTSLMSKGNKRSKLTRNRGN